VITNDVIDVDSRVTALPRGFIGSVYVSADSGNIATTETSVTSVTVTCVASRRYKISYGLYGLKEGSAGDVQLRLKRDGTTISYALENQNGSFFIASTFTEVPGAGSKVYSTTIQFGANTLNRFYTGTNSTFIIVEDIGT
jgi:hypothetical protein